MMRRRRRCGGARRRVIRPGGKGSAGMLFVTGAVSSKDAQDGVSSSCRGGGGQRSPQTRSCHLSHRVPLPALAKTDMPHVQHFHLQVASDSGCITAQVHPFRPEIPSNVNVWCCTSTSCCGFWAQINADLMQKPINLGSPFAALSWCNYFRCIRSNEILEQHRSKRQRWASLFILICQRDRRKTLTDLLILSSH